ncbi:MAG: hypothetical protein C0516_04620 [Gemmatimonas sp.]|nr:hypothetical protein [Gemmatimonas sp.]
MKEGLQQPGKAVVREVGGRGLTLLVQPGGKLVVQRLAGHEAGVAYGVGHGGSRETQPVEEFGGHAHAAQGGRRQGRAHVCVTLANGGGHVKRPGL